MRHTFTIAVAFQAGAKVGFDIGHVICWGGKPVAEIKTAFNNAVERVYLKSVSPRS